MDAAGAVEAVAFSPNDAVLAWVTQDPGDLHVYELGTAKQSPLRLASRGQCLAISHDGKTVAVGTAHSVVQIWSLEGDLKELRGRDSPGGSVGAVAFSPDGKWLAAGVIPFADTAARIRVWKCGSDEAPIVLTDHIGGIEALAFSPDSGTLASASSDGKVKLWATSNWTVRQVLALEDGHAADLAFAPNGGTLAAAVVGKTSVIQAWSPVSGAPRFTANGHEKAVVSLTFSPNSQVLVSGGADGVRRWDAGTGQQRWEPIDAHQGNAVRGLAYSHDGTVLITGASDRVLRIWDTSGWKTSTNTGVPAPGAKP